MKIIVGGGKTDDYRKSQIYELALNNKTCFISWEHLKYLIDNDVREDDKFSLEPIWSYVVKLSRNVTTNRNANFFDRVNKIICNIGMSYIPIIIVHYWDIALHKMNEGCQTINNLTARI